ncbi:MAG: hypothetical protein JNK05_08040 [Myxococcales bacterium]|nr:hypothetical protein [Myxococcales bacterium]
MSRFARPLRARWVAVAAIVALSLVAVTAFAQGFPPRPPSSVPMLPPAAPNLAARAREIADEARLLRHFPIDLLWGTR